MFIFPFQSNGAIFSNLNTNSLKKFQIEKGIKYKFFIAACIIDFDFEELLLFLVLV